MSKGIRVVVCAYHNVGYHCLEELLNHGAEVSLVFTHEDSPTEQIWFKPVRELAAQHGIPCITGDINELVNTDRVRDIAPGFLFSFYYRNMIRKELLDIPRRGALNLHGSLLPKYRGRVPVNWVVINGETETGATLHYMVKKPDAGDIVDQEKVAIEFTDTAFDVFNKVTDAAVKVIARAWPLLCDGVASRTPMDLSTGNYFGGRKPDDGLIDWTMSAVRIYNLIRGITHPYPGAFTYLAGKKIIIWSSKPLEGKGTPGEIVSRKPLLVGTGEGLLEISELQAEGKEGVSATTFAADRKLTAAKFQNSKESSQLL